jgi:hypothetical protein
MELGIGLFKDKIADLVTDIANKNYQRIELERLNGRVDIVDLERVIREYHNTIEPLPDDAFDFAEIYTVEKENRMDVYIPLWTKEEGRSDLTLSVLCFLENNRVRIEINDLRVL